MSFDANLRHLPKRTRFMADVESCTNLCPLHRLGVRRGDKIVGVMLEDGHEDPLVRFLVGDKAIEMRESENYTQCWIIFDSIISVIPVKE